MTTPEAKSIRNGLEGVRVLSLESRLAAAMTGLVERHGGLAQSAPSVREVPLEDNTAVFAFADQLLAGQIDLVILLTGVGTRMTLRVAETRHPRKALIDALARTTTIARGPKPVAALRELGLSPTRTVPEPNTWRDLLAALDAHMPVVGKSVAIQAYGRPNDELVAALAERGARVEQVLVYRWALPEDTQPLQQAVERIAAGEVDVVIFTSAVQCEHLCQVAGQADLLEAMREGFKRVLVASIGPTCTKALTAAGLPPDLEPDRPKMGFLVSELARWGPAALDRKRAAADAGVDTLAWRRIDAVAADSNRGDDAVPRDAVFLRACRREPTEYTPI